MDESRKQQAYSAIREAILTGELKEGDRVSEYALSKRLEFSRAPIREAINQLVSQGLLEQKQGAGTYVRTLQPEEIQELYELREWFECGAITSPRFHLNEQDLSEIKTVCDQLLELIDKAHTLPDFPHSSEFVRELYLADARFHLLIMRGSQNSLALKTMQDRWILEQIWSTNNVSYEISALEKLHREHLEIYEQLKLKNYAPCSELLKSHIRFSIEKYKSELKEKRKEELLGEFF